MAEGPENIKWPRYDCHVNTLIMLGILHFLKETDKLNPEEDLDGPTMTLGWLSRLHRCYRRTKEPPKAVTDREDQPLGTVLKNFGPWKTPEKKLAYMLKAERQIEPVDPQSKTSRKLVEYWDDKKKRCNKPNLETTSGVSSRFFGQFYIRDGVVYSSRNDSQITGSTPQNSQPATIKSTGEHAGEKKKKKTRRGLKPSQKFVRRLARMTLEVSNDPAIIQHRLAQLTLQDPEDPDVAKKLRDTTRLLKKLRIQNSNAVEDGGESSVSGEGCMGV